MCIRDSHTYSEAGRLDAFDTASVSYTHLDVYKRQSFIYRENNSRYIGVQYSVEGRDLERAVRDGQAAVKQVVALPQGYRMEWGGEYSQFLEARSQMYFIGPLAVVLIFMILFALYGNFKFPVTLSLIHI